MYRVIRMAVETKDNVVELFDGKVEALQRFDALGDVAKRVQQGEGGEWRDVVEFWRRYRGRPVHLKCIENWNETMACGIDRGSCGHKDCVLR